MPSFVQAGAGMGQIAVHRENEEDGNDAPCNSAVDPAYRLHAASTSSAVARSPTNPNVREGSVVVRKTSDTKSCQLSLLVAVDVVADNTTRYSTDFTHIPT